MKILMLGWEFPPFIKGGLGPATADLAREIAKREHKLTFVLPYKLSVSSKYFNIIFAGEKPEYTNLYEAYNTAHTINREDINPDEKTRQIRSMIDEVKLYAQRLKKILKDIDYEIVHAHDWLTMPAGLTAKAFSRPLVSHIHSTEYYRSGGQGANSQVFDIEYQGMHQSDKVVCISSHVKGVVTKHYSIPESKINIVHNGVGWNAWKIDREKINKLKKRHKLVVYVGRLTIQKGVDYLLQAVKLVKEYEPEALFIIIGDGDMKEQLVNYTISENLMRHVVFTSWLDHEEIVDYYAAADLLVMPSVAEPFGLVALEAALFDTPVIMSKTSGVSDVFKHCLRVDFWDIKMLASHIINVLRKNSLKQELTLNGQRNAQVITWAKAAAKVEKIYDEIT